MRVKKGGVYQIASAIETDLEARETGLSKPQRIALSDIAASMLAARSVNTSELSFYLPRDGRDHESHFRYIYRFLSNERYSCDQVMQGFVPEIMSMLGDKDQQVVVMFDQSHIYGEFEMLMVSMRIKERAIPLAWRVVKTGGAIGFDEQEPLLRRAAKLIPSNIKVLVMADRFYGTSLFIKLCQELGFSYRVRIKGNLTLTGADYETSGHDLLKQGIFSAEQVKICNEVTTNVGIVHDPKHAEAWFIAMDAQPTRAKTLDYQFRWGIESMFSDLKTRGMNIHKTQLKTVERIERLILILCVAMMWAISTGWQHHEAEPVKKRSPDH